MFVGAMPEAGLIQMARAIDFSAWPAVYVCCSGIFRVERTIRKVAPSIDIHSCDVSLLTTAIGRLATGEDMRLKFTGELAWVQKALGRKAGLRERLAALVVAGSYAEFATGTRNLYKQRHVDHIMRNFPDLLEEALGKVDALVAEISIQSYFARDLREHVKAAIARGDGAGVVGFPPTYKGGYEQLYKFIHANTEWDEPSYGIWDPPEDLPKLMDELDAAGVPWYIGGDFEIEGREPVAELRPGRNHAIFGYSSAARRASFNVVGQPRAQPFDYKPIDPSTLTAESTVDLVVTDSARAAFVKDVYLAKHITHANGEVNVLVYLDGMLAGQLVFARSTHQSYHPEEIYLLSDLSTTRAAKISKLICRLAACREVIGFLERHYVRRFAYVVTTAFAKQPVSMKYRSVFELLKRQEAPDGYMLNYGREVTGETAAGVYRWWWSKHGEREIGKLREAAD